MVVATVSKSFSSNRENLYGASNGLSATCVGARLRPFVGRNGISRVSDASFGYGFRRLASVLWGLGPTGIPHFFYSLPRVDDPTCAIYYHLIVLVCARKDGVYKQGYRFRRLTLLQASIHISASFFLSYSISTTIQTSTLGQPSRFLNGGCYERAWTSQVKFQLF